MLRHLCPPVAQGGNHTNVEQRQDGRDHDRGNDPAIPLCVSVVPTSGGKPGGIESLPPAHRATSALSANRSLSPARVVGDEKVTFLNRRDFSSAVSTSDADVA